MKTFSKQLLLAAFFFAAIAAPTPVYATADNAYDFAKREAVTMIQHGYTFKDYTGGFLRDGSKEIISMTCQAGNQYAIIASGDEDTRDIDMAIVDDDNNIIGYDTETKPRSFGRYQTDLALVEFRAAYTGTYYVVVKMEDSRDVGSYYIVLMGVK